MSAKRELPWSTPSTPDTPSSDLARFGSRIRAAREKRELSSRDLALRCGLGSEDLAAIEAGRSEPRRAVVATLDRELGARGVLLDAWARVHISSLVERDADIGDVGLDAYRICVYAPLMVPEQAQDYEYARALESCEPAGARRRPYVLSVPSDTVGPPFYCLLLDETVLHRRIGGVRTMRRQLERLAGYAESDRVAVHVIPARTARHPGLRGGLWALTFSVHHTIAYQPSPHGPGQLVTDAEAIQGYVEALDALRLAALPTADSAGLIRAAIAALDDPADPKAITAGSAANALDDLLPAHSARR